MENRNYERALKAVLKANEIEMKDEALSIATDIFLYGAGIHGEKYKITGTEQTINKLACHLKAADG